MSGAALAVDTAADIGFFPNVYNEDWLFFFDYAAEKAASQFFPQGYPADL